VDLMRDRVRERVRGLLAINGTYGRAFRTVMGSRLVGRTIPMLLRLVKAQAALAGFATKRLAGSDALIAAMKRVGLVSQTIDLEIFRAVAAGFQTIDWRIYSDLLSRLDEHDAEDVLAGITVPVTIITGDKDLMTPPATAEHMHRAINGSRLVVIEGGTHYTPVEYPAIIVDEFARLLERIPGWERKRAAWSAERATRKSSRSTSSAATAAQRSARPVRIGCSARSSSACTSSSTCWGRAA
jgi:pimeloyl-ACP methyl ester carboxylesterase